jgi:hypothetical protein
LKRLTIVRTSRVKRVAEEIKGIKTKKKRLFMVIKIAANSHPAPRP